MKTGETLWLRLVLAWAAGMVFWYCVSLAPWILHGSIGWGLPLFRSRPLPDIPLFLGRIAVFVAAVLAVLCAGDGAGRPVAAFLRMSAERTRRTVPAGFGALAAAFLGLGLAGLWYRPVFAMLALPAAIAGIMGLAPRLRGIRMPGKPWRSPEFALPVMLVGWIALLLCLAPEWFQDPLRYHLFFPRRFLLEHKFIFVERYFFWSYMGLPQMLYGAALALGGGVGAKAVNAAAAAMSLAALLRLNRLAGFSPATSAVVMGLTVTGPGLHLITGATFGEHGCMFLVLLAVEALMDDGAPRSRRLREAAMLGGLALSAKYTAVFGAAGCAVLIATRSDFAEWIAVARRRPAWLAAIVLPFLPFALERWLWTGDPVSPYFGRAGFPTMDSQSAAALDVYYDFAGKVRGKWLKDPEILLQFPVNMAGAHGGFWEHPGPVVPALLPLLLYYDRFAPGARQLLMFFAGSFGVWFTVFGGQSPHYIAGLAGLWTAGLVGAAAELPAASAILLRNVFSFTVFLQALVTVVAVVTMFGPRDVAMGAMSREYYLDHSLAPPGIHQPIRRALAEKFPQRGTVYVLGDDTSYYLPGRVFVDYENGSDPLMWRLVGQSPDAERARIRFRQKGITHILYSTRWPDIMCEQGDEKFRFDDAVMGRMQEFWRRYAVPVLVRESNSGPVTPGSYVFRLADRPSGGPYRTDFSTRLPFLPGTAALVWEGDVALDKGDSVRARELYLKRAAKLPSCAILEDRLARIALARGNRREAKTRLERMAVQGWTSPGLLKSAGR